MEKQKIYDLLDRWDDEFQYLKDSLVLKREKCDSVEYNLLCIDALRLSECINAVTELLIDKPNFEKTK